MQQERGKIVLHWRRYKNLRSAREAFRNVPCIYVLADKAGSLLKIGESRDLWNRYRGGTGNTVEAALHGSEKLFFVAAAPADEDERKSIEANLTFAHKPLYSIHNKDSQPLVQLDIEHTGDTPRAMAGREGNGA